MERKITIIQNILTWGSYFTQRVVQENHPDVYGVFVQDQEINDKVSLWQGDITTLEVDAIVNAANSGLLGGGGVDGCIHAAAGEKLREECKTLNGCEAGDAKITKGYLLPAKHVIHAVGPQTQDDQLLESAYKTSLYLAMSKGLETIAFPCISTGVFGFPKEQAAHTALRTCRHFLEDNKDKMKRIVFVMHLDEDLKIYERLMQRYFPVPPQTL